MTTLKLTLVLPDDVAQDARAANLLSAEAIAELISRELKRRRDLAEDVPERRFGIARGQIVLADDFDEPLADFADYN